MLSRPGQEASSIGISRSRSTRPVILRWDLRSVHQGAGEAGDISEGKSPLAGLISLTATVTDINNASASASVDVGSHLSFLDDGPAMAVSVGSDAEVLVTTHDALTIGAASDTATGDFGALFTSLGNYGADGPGTTVASYALNVTLQGENSGLSSHGATI